VLTIRAARAAERRAILRRLPSTIVVERQAGFMHAADVPTATIARFYVQVARRGGATVYRLRASR
jgi:hypothetical protein